MSTSGTIIAALKYQGGVVIAADSQVTDMNARVRWPVNKLDSLSGLPCVIGFSGSLGRAQVAWDNIKSKTIHSTSFKKRESIRGILHGCLTPVHKSIQESSYPPNAQVPEIALWGLAALSAGSNPEILEFEVNGDTCFHDTFHAIGGGAMTAYAVYRTLGGDRLSELDEPRCLMALLRIIRTAVGVEMWGVSEPFSAWSVTQKKAQALSEDELAAHLQAVYEWEERERNALFGE